MSSLISHFTRSRSLDLSMHAAVERGRVGIIVCGHLENSVK